MMILYSKQKWIRKLESAISNQVQSEFSMPTARRYYFILNGRDQSRDHSESLDGSPSRPGHLYVYVKSSSSHSLATPPQPTSDSLPEITVTQTDPVTP